MLYFKVGLDWVLVLVGRGHIILGKGRSYEEIAFFNYYKCAEGKGLAYNAG